MKSGNKHPFLTTSVKKIFFADVEFYRKRWPHTINDRRRRIGLWEHLIFAEGRQWNPCLRSPYQRNRLVSSCMMTRQRIFSFQPFLTQLKTMDKTASGTSTSNANTKYCLSVMWRTRSRNIRKNRNTQHVSESSSGSLSFCDLHVSDICFVFVFKKLGDAVTISCMTTFLLIIVPSLYVLFHFSTFIAALN